MLRKMSVLACFVLIYSAVASPLQASVIDATTSGDWIGVYGDDGYILCNYDGGDKVWSATADKTKDVTVLPSYVTDYSYNAPYTYKWFTGEPDASPVLDDPRSGSTTRESAVVYKDGAFTTSLTLATNAAPFQLAVYAADLWGAAPRAESIATKWQGEATAFDLAEITSFASGKWAVFDINPNGKTQLDIVFTPLAGSNGNEVVCQGIMFSAVPEPASMVLMGSGLFGLLAYAWRKR